MRAAERLMYRKTGPGTAIRRSAITYHRLEAEVWLEEAKLNGNPLMRAWPTTRGRPPEDLTALRPVSEKCRSSVERPFDTSNRHNCLGTSGLCRCGVVVSSVERQKEVGPRAGLARFAHLAPFAGGKNHYGVALPARAVVPVLAGAQPPLRASAGVSRRAPRTPAAARPRAADAGPYITAPSPPGTAAAAPWRSWATNDPTAASVRPHSCRPGQCADRCNTTRRAVTTTTAPAFHSRCLSVLTVADATSGTATQASRNSTTRA
jgi:hypothetical protein